MKRIVPLILALLLSALPAFAQDRVLSPALERARAAVERGDIPEAERSLAAARDTSYDPNDFDFTRGTIAAAKKDYTGAIAAFRAVLARDPTLNRVRLDLARAYYLKGDDDAAAFHFRAAMAQGVPPDVQRNIDIFLDQMRRRKRWDVAVSFAVTPDNNINAATSAQQVSLFGLPFDLDNAARQTSGTGLAMNVSGGYQFPLSSGTRLKTGIGYSGLEYGNPAFSDRTLGGLAGPRFLLGGGAELSVLATGAKRWYGGRGLSHLLGGRVEGQAVLSPRYLLLGMVGLQKQTFEPAAYNDYTGLIASGSTTLIRAFDAVSFARVTLGLTHEGARLQPLRDTQYSFGLGYYRESLPGGFVLNAGAQSVFVRYEAALPAFGIARRDTILEYRLSASNKKIFVLGFTPVVTWVHTDRYSNINLFAFHRNRFELGVVRNF